jgi:hypothetical protein
MEAGMNGTAEEREQMLDRMVAAWDDADEHHDVRDTCRDLLATALQGSATLPGEVVTDAMIARGRAQLPPDASPGAKEREIDLLTRVYAAMRAAAPTAPARGDDAGWLRDLARRNYPPIRGRLNRIADRLASSNQVEGG